MRAGRVLETCIYAPDLEAAEAFYTQVLGLEAFARVAGRHVFFRCGSSMFLVFNPDQTLISSGSVPAHGTSGSGHVAFAIQAREIQLWREQLLSNNVAIEKEVTWPNGGLSLYFRDPAGNSLELTTPRTWGLQDGKENHPENPARANPSDEE